jgi:hypothetical protein
VPNLHPFGSSNGLHSSDHSVHESSIGNGVGAPLVDGCAVDRVILGRLVVSVVIVSSLSSLSLRSTELSVVVGVSVVVSSPKPVPSSWSIWDVWLLANNTDSSRMNSKPIEQSNAATQEKVSKEKPYRVRCTIDSRYPILDTSSFSGIFVSWLVYRPDDRIWTKLTTDRIRLNRLQEYPSLWSLKTVEPWLPFPLDRLRFRDQLSSSHWSKFADWAWLKAEWHSIWLLSSSFQWILFDWLQAMFLLKNPPPFSELKKRKFH